MLKKRVAALDAEVKSDYVTAAKRSVLDYLLLDAEERQRLGISVRPGPWEPSVVRAPVPWHQNFLQESDVMITVNVSLKLKEEELPRSP